MFNSVLLTKRKKQSTQITDNQKQEKVEQKKTKRELIKTKPRRGETTFKYCFYYFQTPTRSNIHLSMSSTSVIIASAVISAVTRQVLKFLFLQLEAYYQDRLVHQTRQTVGTQPSSNSQNI